MWGILSRFFSMGLPSFLIYPSLGLTLVVIVIGLLRKMIKNKIQFMLWSLLIVYAFIVVCSTVVFRPYIGSARCELMPLWTYNAVINHTPGVKVWDIVLNVILFIPLGFFVKMLFPKLSIGKMVLIAVLCSLSIEILQNVFSKGISQFDDIMHNALGSAIGWQLGWIALHWKNKSISNTLS